MFVMSFSKKQKIVDVNMIYGISYDCPVLERRGDCPLKAIDGFSFYEKVKWIQGLSREQKEQLLQHHKDCSANRL